MNDYIRTERGRARDRARNKKRRINNTLSWILCIGIAVAIALLVRAFLFEPIKVDGSSMLPTLHSKQSLAIEKVTRYFSLPSRGDIVIVHYPGKSDNFVKRVIGLPGDTVEIKDSVVYINGEALSEDYTSSDPYGDMSPIVVPDDSIFVMGDNRANSQDSRYVGSIAHDAIVGRALFVIWPLNEIHWVAQ